MTNYYEWNNDFSNVYLEDSYVEALNENKNTIEFLMEFVLTEKHPLYTPPKIGEQYCYMLGKIVFTNVKEADWKEKTFMQSQDADGKIDYGNIHSLALESGKYHLYGDWGEVFIESDPPKLFY